MKGKWKERAEVCDSIGGNGVEILDNDIFDTCEASGREVAMIGIRQWTARACLFQGMDSGVSEGDDLAT